MKRRALPVDRELKDAAEIDPSANENGPFEHVGGDQEVEGDAAEAVLLEESHEEAEADEHHRMNVHEHCSHREKQTK